MTLPPWVRTADGGALLQIKVVPGASRSRLAGPHGDRLKVHVAAPPERGKANAELCSLLAEVLALRTSAVTVARGTSHPQKTVRVEGLAPAAVAARLEASLA